MLFNGDVSFQLKMALVDKRLPVATPDDGHTLVAGHLKHQVGQLLEPGPVDKLSVHAQWIKIHSFAGQVLRLHRLRLALPDILALFLHGTQSLRHVEGEGAPCSAFNILRHSQGGTARSSHQRPRPSSFASVSS